MTRIVLKSKVGADGTLHLDVPVGLEAANREVRVVIEAEPAASQQEYHEFLKRTAGAWQGDFECPEQGTLEERSPL